MAFHNVPPNGFPDLPDVEELEAVEKDVTALKTATAEQGAAITALGNGKTDTAVIAPGFDAESGVYSAGDLVMEQGKLYEFTSDHETAGAWDPTEVSEKTVADELSAINSNLTNLTDAIGWDNHKNLLPMILSNIKAINTDGTWNGNVYSVNGIDYTVSLDNSGAINKITANGTAQYNAELVLADNAVLSKLSGKNIVLNGAMGGSSETYFIQARGYNGTNSTASRDGDSANFTPTTAFSQVLIITTGGKTVTNVDFYPMLRLVGANATFDVYHPVIGLAVEELQGDLSSLGNHIDFTASNKITVTGGDITKVGNTVFIDITIQATEDINAYTAIISGLPTTGTRNTYLSLYDNTGNLVESLTRVYGNAIYSGYALTNSSYYFIKGFYIV